VSVSPAALPFTSHTPLALSCKRPRAGELVRVRATVNPPSGLLGEPSRQIVANDEPEGGTAPSLPNGL